MTHALAPVSCQRLQVATDVLSFITPPLTDTNMSRFLP
jgi:hypothetical protein